jgi:hypothetical protein
LSDEDFWGMPIRYRKKEKEKKDSFPFCLIIENPEIKTV